MKEFTRLLLTVLCLSVGISFTYAGGGAPCLPNTTPFGNEDAPNISSDTVVATTCAFAGEYSTFDNLVAGESYRAIVSTTTGSGVPYVTVYQQGNSNALNFGFNSVTFIASTSGTYELHVTQSDTSGNVCLTESACHIVGLECLSCAAQILGCTDPLAQNYDSTANTNDGSCTYAVPANDSCGTATAIACGDTVSGTTAGASTASVSTCGTSLSTAPGVWYSVTGNGGTITASLCGSAYDTKLGVFEGACDSLLCVDGNDDFCGLQSNVTFPTTSGTTYYIYVTGFSTSNGAYTLTVDCPEGCTDPAAANYNPNAGIDDGSCLYAVSFAVDMNCPDPASPVIDTVFVTGPFCGFCATGFPLADADLDGIWEGTYLFPAGPLEYKYMINNFTSQENLIDDMQNGASCAPVTDFFSFANRLITVSGPTTLNEVYGSCGPCQSGTPGCTDPAAQNFDSTATIDDGSCIYDVTFSVDMRCSGESFSSVSISGPFCGFCGSGFELSDADSNGIYEGTFPFASPVEYKYIIDGFAGQENLIDDMQNGASCAPITDFFSFANRLISFGGDTAVDDNYGSCDDCVPGCTDSTALNFNPLANFDDGSCITTVDLTLTVDMCNEVVDSAGVYVAGTFNGFDPTATQMMNIGGTVYQTTVQVPANSFVQYKFLNGPSFAGQETVPGACGVDNGFGAFDRGLDVGAVDTAAAPVAFGTCGPCVVPTNVTFIVNMCTETVDSSGVYLAGSFNGFNPAADQMLPIGGNRYAVTLSLTAGQFHTYKHLNGPSFAGQESVPGDCGQSDGFGAFNRTFTVPSADTTLGPVRFGSCSEDCPVCPDPAGQVGHLLTITGGSFPGEIGYSLVNSATGDTVVVSSCGGTAPGTTIDTLCLDTGANYCFEAYDDWGDGWNGGTYAITEISTGAVVISGSPNNGVAGDGTDVCDASQLEETSCFSVGVIEGCTDPAAANYNPNATVDDSSCVFTPANDLCDDAIAVNCGDTVSGTTIAATNDTSLGTCGTSLVTAGGVWYVFAGDGSPVTASTCGSPYDTKLGVFEGACDSLICIGGNDDFCALQSQVVFSTTLGTNYYIYVTGFGANTGDFDLTINCAILGCTNPAAVNFDSLATVDDGSCIFAPANDSCQNAIAVACGDSVAGSTAAASVDNVPLCGTSLNTAGGVWYSFAGTGDSTVISLCGSGYDTKLGIFKGSCDSLLCIGGNDDFCGLQSQVSFNSVSGTTYYLLVTGFGSAKGNFNLTVDCVVPVGCGVPQNLAAPTTAGSGSVTLSWDAVPTATTYTVEGTRAGLGTIYTFNTGVNSLTVNGLAAANYLWRVRANCPSGMSDFSPIAAFEIEACPAPDSVFTTNISATGATANWTAVPEAIGYFVYANRIGVGPSGTAVITVAAPTTSLTGNNLLPGATYQYAVVARCADFNSVPSMIDTFTTGNSVPKADWAQAGDAISVKLYPNPASSVVNIELSTFEAIEGVSVTIFDLKGQLVYEVNGETVTNNLNIQLPSEMVNGVYQLHVRYADKFFNEKLIIAR